MPLYKHYSTTQILTRFSVGFVFGCTVSPLKSVTIRSAAMPFAFKTSATLFARFSDKIILMPGLPVSLSAYPVTATLAVGYFSRCFTKDSILASWSSWIFAEFSAKKTLDGHHRCRFRLRLFYHRFRFGLFHYRLRFVINGSGLGITLAKFDTKSHQYVKLPVAVARFL